MRAKVVLWAPVLVGASAANYMAWLGWDQSRRIPSVEGPYQGWQWWGLAAGVAVIGAVAGWHRHPVQAVVIVPFATAISALVDWTPEYTGPDGMGGMTAIMILVAAAFVVVLFAGSAAQISGARDTETPSSRPPAQRSP